MASGPHLKASEVKVASFSSNDQCGQNPSFDLIDTSAYDPSTQIQGESLRVYFNEFFLSTEQQGTTQKNCVLDAQIAIPAGFRFRPLSAAADGSYSIQPQGLSQGFIKVSYVVQPQGWSAEKSNTLKPFTGEGNINCMAQLQEASFVGCSNEETLINLHTNIDLRLDQNGSGQSQMDLDATRESHDLAWKWELQPCSVAFETHDFQSQFIAYDGTIVPINLRFTGAAGVFVTANSSGAFSEIHYLNNGRSVEGNWSLDGKAGSFVFHLQDETSGRFIGTWVDRDSPSVSGAWSGEYLSIAPKDNTNNDQHGHHKKTRPIVYPGAGRTH
ncbi:MAG: DUF4360 domain-containing protein [Proteobacteria bacterium]|nr:DUF4360 domain-containing protein [Pseudomonadota bacterium]